MATRIRAIYESGQLRLLDKVDLAEGQEVEISIQVSNESDAIREALKHMTNIQWPDPNANPNPEIEEAWNEIYHSLEGCPSVSEIIIEERGEV
ncbi:MAG: antitoxin family protein [Anaerolineae bacterium]|jgi:predicted DNA-binding antitoxin AbrB/MazE fold protein|nr:antitoxin family protein [Anaerolineae bacterium]